MSLMRHALCTCENVAQLAPFDPDCPDCVELNMDDDEFVLEFASSYPMLYRAWQAIEDSAK